MPSAAAERPAPAVSIIIPAYNTARYIGETLDSVMAQTFTDYEAIVVNDGSPDTEVLERVLLPYRDRLVYLRRDNEGLSAARNAGIMAARGRYVALLDSDDAWEPEYLEAQVSVLERDPDVDVIYADARLFGDSPNAGRTFMEVCPSNGEVTFESLITQQCQVWVSVTGRREAFLRAGLFDTGLNSVEDFDLWLRIVAGGGRIAYQRRVLGWCRKRQGSLSSDRIWMGTHVVKVLEKADRTLPLTPAQRTLLRQRLAYFTAQLALDRGKKALRDGDARGAAALLADANRFFRSLKLTMAIPVARLAPGLLRRACDVRDRLVLGSAGRGAA